MGARTSRWVWGPASRPAGRGVASPLTSMARHFSTSGCSQPERVRMVSLGKKWGCRLAPRSKALQYRLQGSRNLEAHVGQRAFEVVANRLLCLQKMRITCSDQGFGMKRDRSRCEERLDIAARRSEPWKVRERPKYLQCNGLNYNCDTGRSQFLFRRYSTGFSVGRSIGSSLARYGTMLNLRQMILHQDGPTVLRV